MNNFGRRLSNSVLDLGIDLGNLQSKNIYWYDVHRSSWSPEDNSYAAVASSKRYVLVCASRICADFGYYIKENYENGTLFKVAGSLGDDSWEIDYYALSDLDSFLYTIYPNLIDKNNYCIESSYYDNPYYNQMPQDDFDSICEREDFFRLNCTHSQSTMSDDPIRYRGEIYARSYDYSFLTYGLRVGHEGIYDLYYFEEDPIPNGPSVVYTNILYRWDVTVTGSGTRDDTGFPNMAVTVNELQ